MLATGLQTATLESFHAVLYHFPTKIVAFSYQGMLTRYLYNTDVVVLVNSFCMYKRT